MRHCTTARSRLWCGQGRSFVCDVNGWSFVKNSRKYHEDCALLLMEFFEAAVKPSRKGQVFSTIAPMLKYKSNHSNVPTGHRSTTANTPSPYTHCLLALLAVLAGVAVVAHHVV
eukprot:13310-Heterococcus_DN1.PRE.1